MRVLVYVPQSRYIPLSLHSVLALDPGEHEVVTLFDRSGNTQATERTAGYYEAAKNKMNRARQQVLDGGFDALLSIEDDIIVPPDALIRLHGAAQDGALVAYGLTVWRNRPHRWSATIALEPVIQTVGDYPEWRASAWGNVIQTAGCGLFCTLLSREFLEQYPFRTVGAAAADWGVAYDAGQRQVTHCGVICGHVEPGCAIYWPDPVTGVRIEEFGDVC